MMHERREFLALAGAAALAPLVGRWGDTPAIGKGGTMYGLIGKISAVAGQRDALAHILLESTRAMPGCLSYVVAADKTDPDAALGHRGVGQCRQPPGVARPARGEGCDRERPSR